MAAVCSPESAGKTIVGIVASSGIRYVKHPMWEAERVEAEEALPMPPDIDTEFPILRWSSEDYTPPESYTTPWVTHPKSKQS
eukprot:SAG31_NODE_22595_length_522_cov_0.903073_1_plen_82_part_00